MVGSTKSLRSVPSSLHIRCNTMEETGPGLLFSYKRSEVAPGGLIERLGLSCRSISLAMIQTCFDSRSRAIIDAKVTGHPIKAQ